MATTQYLGGKAEIAIGNLVIEPQFLQTITVNFQEGTRSVNSLGGVISTPSQLFETAEATFTMILPSMDALKQAFPHIYEAPTGAGEDLSGRIKFGGNTCSTLTPVPVNIHYTCQPNSDNDFHINAGLVVANFNPTWNDTDALTVEVTILAQPDENGEYGFAGAGDLTQKTLWDATTQSFVPIISPSA